MNPASLPFRVQTSAVSLTGSAAIQSTPAKGLQARLISQQSYGGMGEALTQFKSLQQSTIDLTQEDPDKVFALIEGGKVIQVCLLEDTADGPRETARALVLSSYPLLNTVLAELDEMLRRKRAPRTVKIIPTQELAYA